MPKLWLIYALATTILWGVWGAFTGVSAQRGFPDTLVYCVWALTMIVPALIVVGRVGWKLERDPKSLLYGLIIGLLGAGGQMLLFYTVNIGPTYLIFPIISLSPIVTIVLSYFLLRERTNWVGVFGIVLALIALPMFDFSFGSGDSGHGSWFLFALLIMLAWGLQAYFMKSANRTMSAESIFFYMMISGLMLAPVAMIMTDWSKPINMGADGPWLAAGIQVLNAIGALTLVFAFRHGKAIVVSPLTNAGAPLLTAMISLAVLGIVPAPLKIIGLVLATLAAILLAITPEEEAVAVSPH
jgi:uncharacterized membrane protein